MRKIVAILAFFSVIGVFVAEAAAQGGKTCTSTCYGPPGQRTCTRTCN